MTCLGYDSGNFSFLKPSNFRQQSFSSQRKSINPDSRFIVAMATDGFGGVMLTPKKILIVEDCADVRDLLGEALTLLGWEAILAESDQEALDKLENETPNVILMNMRTPVKRGIKLAASLKAHPAYKNIPILATSGQSRGVSRERCLALGFDDFIAKPLVLPELEMRLTNILSVEKRKIIRATDPVNLEAKRREPISRGVSRQRVA
jgi:CheY-like chemotaxis protein